MPYTLRVSLLEACQLRCAYCLPQGFKGLARSSHLSLEQYEKIARALTYLDIEKIRFTGGEPLLRKDLALIIATFHRMFDVPIALTTNGQFFCKLQHDLVASGLSAVTFHLDTLRAERYAKIMGAGSVAEALKAIDAALQIGLTVKINFVVQKYLNSDELWSFLQFFERWPVEVRFIELMNTGSSRNFVAKHFMSGREILEQLAQYGPIKSLGRAPASSPAENFLAETLNIRFGLIASDTQPFCKDCNRLRLSADGRLRGCLYEPRGGKIRDELDDEAMMLQINEIVAAKRSFHPSQPRVRNDFSMAQIGG